MRIEASREFGARECPSCACEVPANSNRCPICSYHFPAPNIRQRRMRFWGAIIMLALIVLFYVIR